jgi:hypothetical protein
MSLAFGPLLGLGRTRPEGLALGCAGPVHAGLPEALWALAAPMDPARVPAPCGDGRKPRLLLESGSGGLAAAWCTQSGQETRGEHGAGAWERGKGREVGLGRRDSAGNARARLQRGAELGHESPPAAPLGADDARLRRERDGRFDPREAWRDAACLPLVWAKAALKRRTAGEMDGLKGRPWGEQGADEGRVLVREPGQDLGEIVLPGTREPTGETALVTHEAPALLHQRRHRTPGDALRGEHLALVTRLEEQCELALCIGGGIRGSARRDGVAVVGHRRRVDGAQHHKAMSAERGHEGTVRHRQADGERPPAEARAAHADPSADGLRCVGQPPGCPEIGTRDLQTPGV